jgi:hypothetical protein
MQQEYYEMHVNDSFYDYFIGLAAAQERAQELLNDSEIDVVEIYEVTKYTHLIEVHEND